MVFCLNNFICFLKYFWRSLSFFFSLKPPTFSKIISLSVPYPAPSLSWLLACTRPWNTKGKPVQKGNWDCIDLNQPVLWPNYLVLSWPLEVRFDYLCYLLMLYYFSLRCLLTVLTYSLCGLHGHYIKQSLITPWNICSHFKVSFE